MGAVMRRCVFALGIALCLWAIPAHARIWFVRPDGTGDAPTIQAAIDSAAAGDFITLAKGTFSAEVVWCTEKDNLVILSEAGADSTRIVSSVDSSYISVARCSTLCIDGISFENYPGSVLSFWMSSQITISNCRFINNGHFYGKYAIVFEWSEGIDIHGCNISGNKAGINYYEMDRSILNASNTILANAGIGVLLNDVSGFTVEQSIISGNAYGILGFGLDIDARCNDVFNNGENYAILDYPDPTGQNGNISVDPQFCSIDPVAYNNYFLQSDSPCAPGNHPDGFSCELIGCKPVGCSTVGTEKTDWSKVKQLFK